MRDTAGAWSAARTVAEGDNWFVNWADFPSVIATSDGGLAAHWLVKSGPGTYAYDVNISRSKDGGKTWGHPVVPHTDRTQTEHGFVSLLPLEGGRLGAVWVDGRATKDVKEGHDENVPLPVSMALRYAAIDADGKLSDEAVLDERICECCQTSAALTSEGAIAAYRNRSEDEVRDIYFVRRQGGGWSEPRAVHADGWRINGCPVNGPSVAADGRRVAIAWFTGARDAPRVKVAFSGDAGANFGAPVEVDDGEALGRVDVVLLQDGSALVCWMSGGAEGGANKVRRVGADGALGPVSVIARSDVSRSSGFPRMARVGSEAHFAWTQFGKPSLVRTAAADVGTYK
ncbi:MAG: glycoside hydrolase [Acidobacteria bacterium]|nr:glycoside hydrolase [Acidobacteriota bacterium]MCA1641425.1 glycoside hydrolase [Acidobacteriota bacterium]